MKASEHAELCPVCGVSIEGYSQLCTCPSCGLLSCDRCEEDWAWPGATKGQYRFRCLRCVSGDA